MKKVVVYYLLILMVIVSNFFILSNCYKNEKKLIALSQSKVEDKKLLGEEFSFFENIFKLEEFYKDNKAYCQLEKINLENGKLILIIKTKEYNKVLKNLRTLLNKKEKGVIISEDKIEVEF